MIHVYVVSGIVFYILTMPLFLYVSGRVFGPFDNDRMATECLKATLIWPLLLVIAPVAGLFLGLDRAATLLSNSIVKWYSGLSRGALPSPSDPPPPFIGD